MRANMRSVITVYCVLLATVLCHSASAQQNEPPKLEPVFSDDFSKDSRADYKVTGDVSWEPGKLRIINGGAWTTVRLQLEPVKLTDQRPRSGLRVWFGMEEATDCCVRLSRELRDDHVVGSVALIDTGEKDGKPIEQVVREVAVAGDAELGDIGIEYRRGVVTVAISRVAVFAAYVENGPATVRAVAMNSLDTALHLHSFGAAANKPQTKQNTAKRRYTDDEKQRLAIADGQYGKAARLYREGKYAEAIKAMERSLEIEKTVLGEQHSYYVTSINNLAVLYVNIGDYARAEPLYKQALEIRKKVLGEQHPEYATCLHNLAELYAHIGDYARAEPLYQQSLKIDKKVLGEQHPLYATSLNNLAELYARMGDYARAEPLVKQALEITKKVFGEQHPHYARSLDILALLHMSMSDYARAEPLYKQALEIRKKALGEQHPVYASSLSSLALLYKGRGDYARAEPLYKQALEIRKKALGRQHPDYANSLNNLAVLYKVRGDYGRAEPLSKRALEIRKKSLGEQHPDYANSLNNLALVYLGLGDYGHAEPLIKQALEIRKKVLGEQHPDYANSISNLAGLYWFMGDFAGADPYYKQTLDIQRTHLSRNAVIQSARQQKRNQQKARRYLDTRLSNTLVMATPDSAGAAADLWQWKGAVTARQQSYRKVASEPKLALLFAELRSITQQLSVASGKIPIPPAKSASEIKQRAFRQEREIWEQRLANLTRERESLEQQIAAGSLDFRRIQEPLTTHTVQSLLPKGTAFIDFLDYDHSTPDPKKRGKINVKRCYLAVVVPSEGAVGLVGLGAADPIREAINEVRRPLRDQNATTRPGTAASRALRKLLWLPIEQHLKDVTTVIVSPDTALGTLPFASLPGRTEGSYLIEEYRFALLPMAGMLRSFFDEDAKRPPATNGLLVLGDVNYDTNSLFAQKEGNRELGPASIPRGGDTKWTSLPGFEQELSIVRGQFESGFGGNVTTLQKDAATESEFIAKISQHSVLHLITHGYFADPEFEVIGTGLTGDDEHLGQSQVDRLATDKTINKYLPGLLSGLALAGANNSPPDDDPQADGILTASEIETLEMNHVDLVVLSACETGLGAVAGGEGLTGLQRCLPHRRCSQRHRQPMEGR
jgi:tetratricopeptide (TPR) repeat protein